MMKSNTIDVGPSVSQPMVVKAVKSLISHTAKSTEGSKSNLLQVKDLPPHHLALNITLSRVPSKPSFKPIRIDVPHDVVTDEAGEEAEACLIVKDESKAWTKEFIESNPSVSFIKKVVTLSKLRSDYKEFKDRRDLLRSYDLFLADDRILPMLSAALGKSFFEAKKQPVPIKLTRRESLETTLIRATKGSTYLVIPAGTQISVKCGKISALTELQLAENTMAAIKGVVPRLPGKWGNVREIGVRVGQSVMLPVYARTAEEIEAIKKMQGQGTIPAVVEDESEKEATEQQNKEKKRKAVAEAKVKSPLVKALKKKKAEDEEEKKKKEEVSESNRKAKRKEKQPEERPATKKSRREAQAEDDAVKVKSPKKAKVATEPAAAEPAKESATFVASKKFKGARKGYAFKKGNKGVGYYKDTPPPFNVMLAQSLAADSSRRGDGRGKGKGKGKKGGRGRR